MALAPLDIVRFICGDSLPVFRTTSTQLAGFIAPLAESGLIDPRTGQKVPGFPLGSCGRDSSGGLFHFDEHQIYQAGILADTNVKVVGKVGNRKSAIPKMLIYYSSAFGFRTIVPDPKGEYVALANAIKGARVITFDKTTLTHVNPLDRLLDLGSQNELLEILSLPALATDRVQLDVVQKSILWSALEDAHTSVERRDPLLSDLVERLGDPTPAMVQHMGRSKEVVATQAYELFLAYRRYVSGDLRGAFHEATTEGLFDPTPLLVLNCENLKGPQQVAMIALVNFFTESKEILGNPKRRFHRVVLDETWELAKQRGFVESVRRGFKLGGTRGTSYWLIVHHLSNLLRSAGDDSIQDLIADSSTTILGQQDMRELNEDAVALHLSPEEMRCIGEYGPGQFMVKMGTRPGIEITLPDALSKMPFLETRHRLKGTMADTGDGSDHE